MFYSCIFEDYGFDLQRSIQERQETIVDCYCDLWHDAGDEIYDGMFRSFFPAGFIDRDRERAKKIIRDIRDIVHSPIIRKNPEAIYCFVMYRMIGAWFDFEMGLGFDLLPKEVEEYLSGLDEKKKGLDGDETEELTDQINEIKGWFTDADECLRDFRNAYDQDYSDESMAENAAEAYLEYGYVPESWGVEIRELVDLLPNDLYEKVIAKLKEEDQVAETKKYVDSIWPRLESSFHVISHSESKTSLEGARDILWIFKDWVENNGGWKDVQNVESSVKEKTIQRLIFLGAKTYLIDQNLDMICEGNIGVGQEDFKISRGNDKTVIEVKVTSNPRCRHGYEKQLPRYAEAEHTNNMIFCLIDLEDEGVVEEIKGLQGPELYVIDATPKKSASVM